jgi:hypothetical protein
MGWENLTHKVVPNIPTSLMPPHFSNPIRTIYSLHAEYFGLGNPQGDDYLAKPVEGGFYMLESRFKNKWRHKYSPAEQKHFSRVKVVIKALDVMEEDEMTLTEAMDYFQTHFVAPLECNSKLANMEKWIKKQGYVEKKQARGKHAGSQHTVA